MIVGGTLSAFTPWFVLRWETQKWSRWVNSLWLLREIIFTIYEEYKINTYVYTSCTTYYYMYVCNVPWKREHYYCSVHRSHQKKNTKWKKKNLNCTIFTFPTGKSTSTRYYRIVIVSSNTVSRSSVHVVLVCTYMCTYLHVRQSPQTRLHVMYVPKVCSTVYGIAYIMHNNPHCTSYIHDITTLQHSTVQYSTCFLKWRRLGLYSNWLKVSQ